jgi:hypothetical protein
MDLGYTIVSALPELRRHAESRMLDTCTVRRVAGDAVDDEGRVTPTYVTLYAGACRVQTGEAQERNPEVAGSTATTQRYSVHIPVGAYQPEVGDVVTIATATLDPYLPGRTFRVVALLHKSQATAYRLGVEELS